MKRFYRLVLAPAHKIDPGKTRFQPTISRKRTAASYRAGIRPARMGMVGSPASGYAGRRRIGRGVRALFYPISIAVPSWAKGRLTRLFFYPFIAVRWVAAAQFTGSKTIMAGLYPLALPIEGAPVAAPFARATILLFHHFACRR